MVIRPLWSAGATPSSRRTLGGLLTISTRPSRKTAVGAGMREAGTMPTNLPA